MLLIPTDPEVQDALDNFVPKESSVWSHQVPKIIHSLLCTPVILTSGGNR